MSETKRKRQALQDYYDTRGGKLRSMGFPELALAYVTQWRDYVRSSR